MFTIAGSSIERLIAAVGSGSFGAPIIFHSGLWLRPAGTYGLHWQVIAADSKRRFITIVHCYYHKTQFDGISVSDSLTSLNEWDKRCFFSCAVFYCHITYSYENFVIQKLLSKRCFCNNLFCFVNQKCPVTQPVPSSDVLQANKVLTSVTLLKTKIIEQLINKLNRDKR